MVRVICLLMDAINYGRKGSPRVMVALRRLAPGVRIETSPLPSRDIAPALDSGRIDFAFGFLPTVKDTQRVQLLKDRYIVLLRDGHPLVKRRRTRPAMMAVLRQLELVAVRTHSDTLRILELLQLEDPLRLTTEHFMVLPSIVKATDLAVVMPRNIAQIFCSRRRLRHHRAAISVARFHSVAALEQTL